MKYRISYGGSIFWLIFWAIVCFPIGLVLLLTKWSAEGTNKRVVCEYAGSRGWLCFWVIAFFPVAFVLLIHNGFHVES